MSKHQTEQSLDAPTPSQQAYRDLLDALDDLLFLLSAQGVILEANRRFTELLGLLPSGVIGHPVQEFFELSNCEAARKAWPQLVDTGEWKGVLRVKIRKTGAEHQFDCTARAMSKDGQMVGASVLARDITRSRETEALFSDLFETIREGVYFTTPDGKLLDANPALVRMLGYENKKDLLGVNVQNLFYDQRQRNAELAALERNQSIEDCEIVLRRKDGSPLICLDSSVAIRDAAGEIVRYQGTLEDITLRRAMEKRLHQEQEFARRLVESFPDLIVVLDAEGRYTYVSPRVKESLGFEPQDLLGRKLGERMNPDDRPAMLGMLNDLLSGRRKYGTMEYRPQDKRGSWRVFRATASPLYNEEGKIAGVIASSRDVTDLKRMEQQLIQTEKLAAMGQMIAGVAHELNNPLTAILGVSELLRGRVREDSMQRQLDLVHRQARRAASIVQSLLAFSRPAAPRKAPIDLSEVVARTLQLHEHSLRTNRISVEIHPVAESAGSAHAPQVLGDANQLMQVFLNLITNAEQAIREIRDHGTIRIVFRRDVDCASVTVQGDGPGISKDVLPLLFDPFFTTKRPGRGTGLGLSISMAIVREHGGNIDVQTVPGSGSSFTVVLPMEVSSNRKEQPDSTDAALRGDSLSKDRSSLKGRQVLVVDDEDSIRDLVQDGLKSRGMIVDCAADRQQALALASQRQYDAILCDLNLQQSSGSELILRLRSALTADPARAEPALILMTGDLLDPSKIASMKKQGMHILEKPFQISDLIAALQEGMGSVSATPAEDVRS